MTYNYIDRKEKMRNFVGQFAQYIYKRTALFVHKEVYKYMYTLLLALTYYRVQTDDTEAFEQTRLNC